MNAHKFESGLMIDTWQRLKTHPPLKGLKTHTRVLSFTKCSSCPDSRFWVILNINPPSDMPELTLSQPVFLPFFSTSGTGSTTCSVHKPGAWESSLLSDSSWWSMFNLLLILIFLPKYLLNLCVLSLPPPSSFHYYLDFYNSFVPLTSERMSTD